VVSSLLLPWLIRSVSNQVVHFAYPTSIPTSDTQIHRLGKVAEKPTALFISPSYLYLVALVGNRAYTFLLPSSPSPLPDGWKAHLIKFVTDHALVCGAFAPTNKLSSASGHKGEDWFATGDEFGVIRLWRGLSQAFSGDRDPSKDADRRLPTTSLAWHAHAVAAIAFTPSGSQLLSVGEESVLVQWHLGSGKREYIPRLGGRPIVSLAVRQAVKGREEEWWMAFADGSVVKVGAGSGRVENVGHGVKIGESSHIIGH
jgi:NET1-associated nuclear protein 1 (U3 small nucleolar RNA-associated protein 17)